MDSWLIHLQLLVPDPCLTPLPTMSLGGKRVHYARFSKVLGVYIDTELDFKKHSSYTLQKCWYTWNKLSGDTNRMAGINNSALSLLFRTVVLTRLLYAAPLWLHARTSNFKDFLARVRLKILGSQFHVSKTLSSLLIGIPPLEVILEVQTIKFILKGLKAEDAMTAKLFQIESEANHRYFTHILSTKRYLKWAESDTHEEDHPRQHLSRGSRSSIRDVDLLAIDPARFMYTKENMTRYTHHLWDDHVRGSFETILKREGTGSEATSSLIHHIDTEALAVCPLLNRAMDREQSSTLMDFIHGHNLRFQDFVFRIQDSRGVVAEEPYCLECGEEMDSVYHKLFECAAVGAVSVLRDGCRTISAFTDNFHIPLLFSRDNNLKRKFRTLVKEVTDNSIFGPDLLS